MDTFNQFLSMQLAGFGSFFRTFDLLILVIQIILHFIFAGAVAKDTGRLVREGRTTWLVSGVTWAFATLVGGVMVAAVYWVIHYFRGKI